MFRDSSARVGDSLFTVWVKRPRVYVQSHLTAFNIQGAVDVADKNRVWDVLEKSVRNFVSDIDMSIPSRLSVHVWDEANNRDSGCTCACVGRSPLGRGYERGRDVSVFGVRHHKEVML
jgi:hypothetical protein